MESTRLSEVDRLLIERTTIMEMELEFLIREWRLALILSEYIRPWQPHLSEYILRPWQTHYNRQCLRLEWTLEHQYFGTWRYYAWKNFD